MQDLIIIVILAILLIGGMIHMVNHFKGKSACCGGGNTYVSKKKLKKVIATKTYVIEGMTCENCKARVERYVNDINGVVGKVNLKKKQLVVSMEREVTEEEIIAAVTKAGYQMGGIENV